MAKKLTQNDLRAMMTKLKTDKSGSGAAAAAKHNPRLKKYKLSSRELALIEEEKRRKAEEAAADRQRVAAKAGVPENFFDAAKTKAFLSLGKAPAKSILKNSGRNPPPATTTGAAVSSAVGQKQGGGVGGVKRTAGGGMKTPGGGSISRADNDPEEGSDLPADFFDAAAAGPGGGGFKRPKVLNSGGDGSEADKSGPSASDAPPLLPEGFFDDPIMDAKARGIEYKDPEEEEWEAFKKEIAVEVTVSNDLQAEGDLEETTERQLEEIDDQIRAWSRVREIEIKKEVVAEKVKAKKEVKEEVVEQEVVKQEVVVDNSDDEELDETEADEFLDWRLKKA